MSVLAALWSLRKRRPGFVALSLVTLAAFVVYPVIDYWLRANGFPSPFGFYDWGAFSSGVSHWQAGEPIYVQDGNGSYHGSYLYPPFALLVFLPFVELFPFREGAMVWGAFSVGLLWLAVQAMVAALDTDVSLHPGERLLLLPALLGFQPLLLSLKLGQTAGFQGGLVCLAAAAMLRGLPVARGRARLARLASGAVTAFVGMAKLPYATAGAHLLADRERLAGAVGAGVAVLAVSVLVFGVGYHQEYVDVLRWGAERGASTRVPSLWLPPYYRPIHWLPHATTLRYLAVAAVALGAALAVDADLEVFALGAAGVPLLAPVTYAYYFVPALAAVVLLVATELRRPGGLPWVPVLGAGLVGFHSPGLWLLTQHLHKYVPYVIDLTPVVDFVIHLRPLFWAQPGLWGNLLLVGLAGVRVAQAVEVPRGLGRHTT